jgi:hypothetical protein
MEGRESELQFIVVNETTISKELSRVVFIFWRPERSKAMNSCSLFSALASLWTPLCEDMYNQDMHGEAEDQSIKIKG